MRLPVRIHEAAEAEIQEAADFYDIESLGLSAEFADEIEHAVEHISLSSCGSGRPRFSARQGAAEVPVLAGLLRRRDRDHAARRCPPEATAVLLDIATVAGAEVGPPLRVAYQKVSTRGSPTAATASAP